jgi:glycosyltransferase involved in cell wall biosynthesis
MVSPHFPPDSSAATHRVRLLAPHLADAGWTPTVLTLEPSAYEGRLDPDLEALVPSSLRVVRAPAWPAQWTRLVGLGDLGLRAFRGLSRACRLLLARERFDALFITVYPVYPALLGPALKERYRIPFVLDYQDPWVGSWGLTVGSGPNGAPDWKSHASRRLGEWLEPRAVNAADALVAVSQGTIDGIVERIPAAARVPHASIPLGFEAADFDALRSAPRPHTQFNPADGLVHVCYVGTLLPAGYDTLRLLLDALRRARDANPGVVSRLRLHFFGTSNRSSSNEYRVLPVARELGIDAQVTEVPGRLDYLDALSVLTDASAIMLLGSSEPHYTASKLYPALLARRPILALFHEASSAVETLRDVGREPTVRVVTYGDDPPSARVGVVARHLLAIASNPIYNTQDVTLECGVDVSARALARRLAGVLDRVCAA